MRYSALSGGFRVWIVNEAQAMTARAVQAWLTALDRINARARFKVACRVLGPERIRELTIHHGRHSFISHALAGGRTLAEVRDAAGHATIAATSVYTHVTTDDEGKVGSLFAFDAA